MVLLELHIVLPANLPAITKPGNKLDSGRLYLAWRSSCQAEQRAEYPERAKRLFVKSQVPSIRFPDRAPVCFLLPS